MAKSCPTGSTPLTSTSRPVAGAPDRGAAPAVARALHILTLLEYADGTALPLSDIARGIGAAKSSTSNVCRALEDGDMIVRTPGGYLLGRRNVELGGAYISQFNQMRQFYAFCERAELLSHEVVQIAMLHGTEAVFLARHEGRAPMRLTASIGSRFPAAPTAFGNALLTTLTDAEITARFGSVQHFPQLTERSVRTCPRCSPKYGRRGSVATPSRTTKYIQGSLVSPWSSRRGPAETRHWRSAPP